MLSPATEANETESVKENATDLFNAGEKYYEEGNKTKAFEYYKKSAEQNHALSQYRLAGLYFKGEGVEKDFKQAFHWCEKAAEQGHVYAQCHLADMYHQGVGVRKDLKQSFHWYKKAAEQDNVNAKYNLAYMYYHAVGLKKDLEQAFYWMKKAAEQDNVDAQFNLACMYYQGEGVKKDLKQAFHWHKKAAGQDNVGSQYSLACMYHQGEGVKKDLKQAFYWIKKAAEQDNVDAQNKLAYMYHQGEGVKKDPKQAFYWIKKAAEQGRFDAQFNLGYMYDNGIGILKDEIEGLAWYYLAKSNGYETNAHNNIQILESKLGSTGAIVAQRRAKEIEKRIKAQPPNGGSQSHHINTNPSASVGMLSRGSGVFVSKDGLILTAAHVLEGASSIKVQTQQGLLAATVVHVDATNDVALLRCNGHFTALNIVHSRNIRLGRSIFTIGFPQVDLQGFSPKLTKGEISSLAGMRDDPRHWQISAPIQPGNSGGPLFDENGDIVGIVVSKLDEISVAAQTGSLTQNVNYALKSAYIWPMLEEHDVTVGTPNDAQADRLEDVVERVQRSVVLIVTYKER